MDKHRLTEVFNLAFRRGANDRNTAGLAPASELQPPTIPAPPTEYADHLEPKVWNEGYVTGYKIGASDTQLASVEEPGAYGMISGYSQEFMEMLGFFERFASDDTTA